jgi:hypothetical protein
VKDHLLLVWKTIHPVEHVDGKFALAWKRLLAHYSEWLQPAPAFTGGFFCFIMVKNSARLPFVAYILLSPFG